MYVITVTIAVSNKPQPVLYSPDGVISSNTRFQSMTAQYSGTGTMYLGDSAVSPTNGLQYGAGASQAISAFNGPDNLLDYYLYGTAGDRMVFMVTP